MLSYHNSTAELAAAGVDRAVISVGSTEQCGPNLPFHLDTLLAAYFARAWGEALDAYVLPTLPFNTAEEHSSFVGTITLRPATVTAVLEEIVVCLRAQGFRKQVLTVGHGGSWWMGAFIKEINARYPDMILVNGHAGADPIWQQALDHAGLPADQLHGGAVSHAIASFLAPDDVRPGPFGQDLDPSLVPFNAYVGWEKLTADGSWGRYGGEGTPGASAEAGRKLLQYFTSHHTPQLVAHFDEACRLKGM